MTFWGGGMLLISDINRYKIFNILDTKFTHLTTHLFYAYGSVWKGNLFLNLLQEAAVKCLQDIQFAVALFASMSRFQTHFSDT